MKILASKFVLVVIFFHEMYAALVRHLHKFILDIDVQINCVLLNEQLKN